MPKYSNRELSKKIKILEQELNFEKLIRKFQELLITQKDPHKIIKLFLEQTQKFVKFQKHIVYFIDENFEFKPQKEVDTNNETLENSRLLMEEGLFAWALSRRKASVIPERLTGEKAILLIPLIGLEPRGVIYIESEQTQDGLSSEILGILTFLTREISLFIENLNLLAKEKHAKQLEILNKEMAHAYEMVGNLVVEKDRVYKELEKSQLALEKKARDLEENNQELIKTNKKLKEIQLELENYGHTLEIKVQERTKELLKTNNMLQATMSRVNKINLKLKEADQLKNDFLSFTAHELRTPLTSIAAFTDLLITEPKALDKKDEFLKIIKLETNRLTRLTNDLLDIIKIEAGKMTWEYSDTQLADILLHSIKLNTAIADNAKITLKKDFKNSLPTVCIDQDKIIQVLSNLIGNAIKFTPDNGIIQISAEVLTKNNTLVINHLETKKELAKKYILVKIKDSGPGISKVDIDKVFQKFKQIKGQKGRYKGTGLGLPISKDIILKHGGNIWVDSKPGKGSIFQFLLPIKN